VFEAENISPTVKRRTTFARQVCILAVNDDGDFDILADLKPDAEDTSFFWAQIDRLALPEAKRAPPVGYAERTIDPPPDPHQRLDSARAPPFYI